MEFGEVEVVIVDEATGSVVGKPLFISPKAIDFHEGRRIAIDGCWYVIREIRHDTIREENLTGGERLVASPQMRVGLDPNPPDGDGSGDPEGDSKDDQAPVRPLRLPRGNGTLASLLIPPGLVAAIVAGGYRGLTDRWNEASERAAELARKGQRFASPGSRTWEEMHELSRVAKGYLFAMKFFADAHERGDYIIEPSIPEPAPAAEPQPPSPAPSSTAPILRVVRSA